MRIVWENNTKKKTENIQWGTRTIKKERDKKKGEGRERRERERERDR